MILGNTLNYRYFLLYFSFFSTSYGNTLQINGWPIDFSKPLLENAQTDPIYSTLVCPSLTRLDLNQKKSELVLLEDINEKAFKESQWVWQLTLKKGLKWWSGVEVSSNDLKTFLNSNLKKHLKENYKTITEVPRFRVDSSTSKNQSFVKIVWQKKPNFGAFVLNELPFHKPMKNKKLNCVGSYEVKSVQNYHKITATSWASKPKYQSIQITSLGSTPPKPTASKKDEPVDSVDFNLPRSYTSNPWVRWPHNKSTCEKALASPMISAIYWNPVGKYTSSSAFRKAMTMITPRGTILRSGAGYLGDLISGPILRDHPGYNKKVYVRPFSLGKSAQKLTSLGYIRPMQDEPRLDKLNQPLKLTLGTFSSGESDLHKVLSESFNSVGISVEYKKINPNNSKAIQKLDGVLMGLKTSFPSSNLSELLHSKSQYYKWFTTKEVSSFDPLIERYEKSLTYQRPDFGVLQDIHKQIDAEEPMSILMQYDQCMVVNSKKISNVKSIRITDPDWIKQIVL